MAKRKKKRNKAADKAPESSAPETTEAQASQESDASTTAESEPEGSAAQSIWRWYIPSLVALFAMWALMFFLSDRVTVSSQKALLNDASLKVSAIDDGNANLYAFINLTDKSTYKPISTLLGDCHTNPERSVKVFRDVLANGTDNGKMLACHMAFFLMQHTQANMPLTTQDVDAIAAIVADGYASKELRAKAQLTLSQLLALRAPDLENGIQLAKDFPKPEPDSADKDAREFIVQVKQAQAFQNALYDEQLTVGMPTQEQLDDEFLTITWSHPAACSAWWQHFGKNLTFDEHIKRFVIQLAP